jgi:hypothetical protein
VQIREMLNWRVVITQRRRFCQSQRKISGM